MGTKKQKKSKSEVFAEVTALNRGELKSKEAHHKSEKLDAPQVEKKAPKTVKAPDQPSDWLLRYINNPDASGAKKVTALLVQGCTLDDAVRVATEYGQKKGSRWGQNHGSIKSHLAFLRQKKLQITESNGVYKIIT